jgi:hypothetical protein
VSGLHPLVVTLVAENRWGNIREVRVSESDNAGTYDAVIIADPAYPEENKYLGLLPGGYEEEQERELEKARRDFGMAAEVDPGPMQGVYHMYTLEEDRQDTYWATWMIANRHQEGEEGEKKIFVPTALLLRSLHPELLTEAGDLLREPGGGIGSAASCFLLHHIQGAAADCDVRSIAQQYNPQPSEVRCVRWGHHLTGTSVAVVRFPNSATRSLAISSLPGMPPVVYCRAAVPYGA